MESLHRLDSIPSQVEFPQVGELDVVDFPDDRGTVEEIYMMD